MKEQEYLRDELNSRIMFTYNHSNTTMGFVITVWSALITLISLFYENFSKDYFAMCMVAPIIIFITLKYIQYASHKYRENLSQIIKISSYFACFYNHPSMPTEDIDSWELITMDMGNNKEYGLNPDEEVLPRMNDEYKFFAYIAFTIIVLFFVASIYFNYKILWKLVFLCVLYILLIIASIYSIIVIKKCTTLKNYHKEHTTMFVAWLKYAIKHKYITKDEVKKKYPILNKELSEMIKNL